MEENAKELAVIPDTGKLVPHITFTNTKEYYSSELSSISCSKNNSSKIHFIPEMKIYMMTT